MAIKRIDFRLVDGNLLPSAKTCFFVGSTKLDENHQFEMKARNWVLRGDGSNEIHLHSDSMAKVRFGTDFKKDFKLTIEEGSLFLQNTTNDWYWFFRPKHLQDIFDEYNINRMVSIDTDEITLPLFRLVTTHEDKSKTISDSSLKKYETFKYWKTHDNIVKSIKDTFLIDNVLLNSNQLIMCSKVRLRVNGFLLIKNREKHCSLYINKNHSIDEFKRVADEQGIKYESVIIDSEPSERGNENGLRTDTTTNCN